MLSKRRQEEAKPKVNPRNFILAAQPKIRGKVLPNAGRRFVPVLAHEAAINPEALDARI